MVVRVALTVTMVLRVTASRRPGAAHAYQKSPPPAPNSPYHAGLGVFWEGEGLEAGGWGVTRVVTNTEPSAHSQRPKFVKAGMEDAEGRVVGTGSDDQHFVW